LSTCKGVDKVGGSGRPSKIVVTKKPGPPSSVRGLNIRYTLDRASVQSLCVYACVCVFVCVRECVRAYMFSLLYEV